MKTRAENFHTFFFVWRGDSGDQFKDKFGSTQNCGTNLLSLRCNYMHLSCEYITINYL